MVQLPRQPEVEELQLASVLHALSEPVRLAIVGHSLVDGEGNLLWTFDQPATFSCYPTPQSGWLALAGNSLTRLSGAGSVLWTRELQAARGMRPHQAVVDKRGFIYVPAAEGMLAFDPRGQRLFGTDFEAGETSPLCPLASGQMALIHNRCLYLVGEQ